jgi:enoyl-CoA hydratase/carnithine racemase
VGATTRLPKLIGLAKAKELILYGELISSEKAYEMGLVTRLVEKDSLDESVHGFTEALTERAPLAISACKELLNSEASLDRAAVAQRRLLKTQDASEGINSFLEKRKPSFTGS